MPFQISFLLEDFPRYMTPQVASLELEQFKAGGLQWGGTPGRAAPPQDGQKSNHIRLYMCRSYREERGATFVELPMT